ncbi:uncharacterized protein LOC110978300 isoform X3 [Acanthaster planci]|uniref:Uncharacterized protein LOC110978300 isoform X3 n=1 Tax=Acanthaster planci TaxID=133434 RepID=A0A8B7Y6P6_ACAPL|nr:uncharacterized protein LOC110978300 isoform X3 [Acanthaster planci]
MNVLCDGASSNTVFACLAIFVFCTIGCRYEVAALVPVRLTDGSVPTEGRVEVFYQGQWGRICHDGWGIEEAMVVCRQLGNLLPVLNSHSHFGYASVPMLLDDVVCTGSETSIDQCMHREWGDVAGCGSHNGHITAGVRCSPSRGAEPPVITCPNSRTVETDPNQNFATVFLPDASASDNNGWVEITIEVGSSTYHVNDRVTLETTNSPYVLQYTARDVIDNTARCSMVITVIDTNPPRFFPDCPGNIFRLVNIGIQSVSVSWPAFNASDSSPPLLWNSSHQPGDVFQTGEITVVAYKVMDQKGNSAYCNFTVTVTGVDFQCPANITVATDPGISTTSVSWMQPKVTFNSMNGQASTTENGSGFYEDDEDYNYEGGDGSSGNRINGSVVYQRDNGETGVRLQSDHQPGDLFSIGATQVIYQVQETEIECRFHVIVGDDEPPKVSGCPDDVIIPVTSSSQLVTHSWIPPILTDNSGQDVSVTFNCLPTTFSECNRAGNGSFSVGDTTVRYTARDMSGNRNVCAFNVTVTEVNLVCPANITAFASPGSTTTSISWSEPVVSGWKGETNFTSNYSPGMTLPIGTYRVSYQQWFAAYDLLLECSFFVGVEGQCPASITSDRLRWPVAVAGSVAKSVKRCALKTANAGQPVALRNCSKEEAPLFFRWEEHANRSCGEVKTEVSLENVIEVEVSKGNAVEVAGFLASQTSKSSEDAQDIEAVSSILENIAKAGSGDTEVTELVLETVSNVILTVGTTIDSESQPAEIDAESSSAIVQSVEAQISLTLQQEGHVSIRQDSIHVEAVSMDPTLATEGLSFASVKQSTTPEPGQGLLAGTEVKTLNSTVIPKDLDVLASAQLPSNIIGLLQSHNDNTSAELQASFLIYADDSLFQSASIRKYRGENNWTRKVAGAVVSLTVENVELVNLTEPLVVEFKEESSDVHCVSWNFELEDGVGDWTTAGCELVEETYDRVKCNCTHATNFAILVDVKGQVPDDEDHAPSKKALDIISQVGCVLSIIALTITVVIYLTIRKLRSGKSRQIFIHFCFSLLMLYIIFLAGVDNAKGSGGGCVFVAALLHYLTLTTMMWMAVEARNMYVSTVKVFPEDTPRYMLKASLIAWGTPLIVLTITLAAATHHYINDHYCFLRPGLVLYIGLLTPIGLILIHSIVTFVLVMRSLLKVKEVSRSQQISKRLHNAVGISVLMGLTWCFGFLAINEAAFAFQLIFCLANSFQGVFVFILFCVRREEVRTALAPYMRRICCGRECHLPMMHPDKSTDAEMVSTAAHTQQSSGPSANLDMSITTPQ